MIRLGVGGYVAQLITFEMLFLENWSPALVTLKGTLIGKLSQA
jgi:hypothetical protein